MSQDLVSPDAYTVAFGGTAEAGVTLRFLISSNGVSETWDITGAASLADTATALETALAASDLVTANATGDDCLIETAQPAQTLIVQFQEVEALTTLTVGVAKVPIEPGTIAGSNLQTALLGVAFGRAHQAADQRVLRRRRCHPPEREGRSDCPGPFCCRCPTTTAPCTRILPCLRRHLPQRGRHAVPHRGLRPHPVEPGCKYVSNAGAGIHVFRLLAGGRHGGR